MNKEVFKLLGKNIKLLRTKYKISQQTLSVFLNISQSQLSLIENGKKEFGVYFLEKIVHLFALDYVDFYSNNLNDLIENDKIHVNMNDLIKLQGLNNFNTLCKSYIDLNEFRITKRFA